MTPTILPDWTDEDGTETVSADRDPDTGDLLISSDMPLIDSTHHLTIPAGALPWLRDVLARMEARS